MTLLVVGGDPAARSRLAHLLTAPGVTVSTAPDSDDSPAAAPRDVGLVLLPTGEPLPEVIRRLLTGSITEHVVVLSDPDRIDGTALIEALMAGADGWLGLDLTPEVLLRSLQGILRGEAGISRRHVTDLIATLRTPGRSATPARGRIPGLTPREHEIFLALTTSGSVRSIAASLSLSEGTVRWYTGRLLRKLKVASRAELALLVPTDAPASHGPALTAVADLPAGARPPAVTVAAETVPAAWRTLPRSELRVVQLVVTGLTNRQVAEALFLSKHTVDSHLKSAFTKLGVRSRVELTNLAHRPQG